MLLFLPPSYFSQVFKFHSILILIILLLVTVLSASIRKTLANTCLSHLQNEQKVSRRRGIHTHRDGLQQQQQQDVRICDLERRGFWSISRYEAMIGVVSGLVMRYLVEKNGSERKGESDRGSDRESEGSRKSEG